MFGPCLVVQCCKFQNFREDFTFVKINSSRNGEITLSFTDVGKSFPRRDF